MNTPPPTMNSNTPNREQAMQAFQDDIRDILNALDLGTHARPLSPHHVVHEEILPEIESLQSKLQSIRHTLDLQWQDAPPDEPGYWWYLRDSYPHPGICRVRNPEDGLIVKLTTEYYYVEDLDLEHLQWAGPIPQPESVSLPFDDDETATE